MIRLNKFTARCAAPAAAVWMTCLPSELCAAERESQSQQADKSGFNLLHPTPGELMRELSADRPDKTDSPYTVDAGHFQVEMDLANTTRSLDQDSRLELYQVAPLNLKLGVLNNLDVHLVLEPFTIERTKDLTTGAVEEKAGMGDLTPRFKVNLWGNDGGRTALGLLPFVKLPTNQDGLGNHSVEGGLKLPFAVDVPGWDLSFMSECDIVRDDRGSGYHPQFANSASVGHRLYGKLSLFLEFYSRVSAEAGSEWLGTVDTWLTYEVNRNLRLDGGAYVGMTSAADDLQLFLGFTWRF